MAIGALTAGAAGGASVNIFINAIDNFSKIFASVNVKMLALGAGIAALGVAGAIAIGKFTKTAIEFESAFAGVKKTVELSEQGFENLNQKLKDLTKVTPVTYSEIARIAELAGQLGVSGVDNISKFTKTISDISATTNLTSEQAATDFARIANIMKLPLDQVDRMGSSIVDLGNNFATTEAEISLFAQRVAGAGAIAGLTTADILAIGTAFSSVGVQAEAGGTAVQKMLIEMNTSVATGGEKLKIFADLTGQTVDEFKDSWEKEAGPTFAKFIEGLGKQGDEAVVTLDELGMSDVRLVRSFLSLANAGDLVTRTFETSNKAWEENNALTKEAEKRYKTAQSQIIIFKNKLSIVGDQMGVIFLPILIKVLDKLGIFIEFLEEHPKLTKFAAVLISVTAAVALLAGAVLILTAIASPWLLIIIGITAGVAALALGMKYLYDKFEVVRDIVSILWSLFKISLLPTILAIKIAVEFLTFAWKSIVEFMRPVIFVISEIVGWIKQLVDWIDKVTFGLFNLGGSKSTQPFSNISSGANTATGAVIKLSSATNSTTADVIKLNNELTKPVNRTITTTNVVNEVIKLNGSTSSSKSSSSSSSSSSKTSASKVISLNISSADRAKSVSTGQPASNGVIYLNDFILTPKGKILKPHPNDTIIGTKNGNGLNGGVTIIIEGDINGIDPEQMAEAFGRQLKQSIRI